MCSAAHVWRSLKNVPKLERVVYSWVTGMTLRQLGFLSRWQREVSDRCVEPNVDSWSTRDGLQDTCLVGAPPEDILGWKNILVNELRSSIPAGRNAAQVGVWRRLIQAARKCTDRERAAPLRWGEAPPEKQSDGRREGRKEKCSQIFFDFSYSSHCVGNREHEKSIHRLEPKIIFPVLWLPFHLKLPGLWL